MQVNNVNNTSFGINAVRFLEQEAVDNFNKMARTMDYNQQFKMFQEIKNIKPKIGPDVDVFVGSAKKLGSNDDVYLSAQSKLNKQEGFEILNSRMNDNYENCFEGFKHALSKEQIVNTFKKLVNSVDEARAAHKKPVHVDTYLGDKF